jgi:hypothetical protein
VWRHCGRCGADKLATEFHRRRRYGWQAWCKTCRRAYDRDYHQRTRPIWAEVIEWYRCLKTDKPCADCGGIFHYAAMEWDHRPGSDKVAEVSAVVAKTRSKRRVLEEIAKCDLVCANCHAVRTYIRLMNGA